MRKNKWFILLVSCMAIGLSGCENNSNVQTVIKNEDIELIDPVTEEEKYEVAERRTLYDANAYVATVVPYVEEYYAEAGFSFGRYGAYPGETVKKGTELIAADTKSMDEQIKNKKESILSMEEEYEEYVKKQQEEMENLRRLEERHLSVVKYYEANKPAEYLASDDPEADPVRNPDFDKWQAEHDVYEGSYRITKHQADTIQLELDQRKALYELEIKHQRYELKTMQKNRQKASIATNMDGELVAVRSMNPGDYVRAETPMVAVGDVSQKLIKCEFINSRTIKNAEDVYAMVNGKRYEVEYQAISSEEYARLSSSGVKIYSTFKILDADDGVNVGDYAVIAVVKSRKENVVTIPKSAINRDDSGYYVYAIRDGASTYTSLQLGYSDGTYTEITSGLEAGDQILYTAAAKFGTDTVTIQTGEFYENFNDRAELEYASSEYLTNDLEYGTMYFKEMQVSRFQHVEKGDVICTVRVEPDNIALKRNETRLTRLKERLADYKKINEKNSDQDYYKESVQRYEEQIKDVEEAIAKQKSDFAVKVIRANKTGTIVELREYAAEDVVQKGDRIARIADEDTCYLIVEDKNQVLQYGNEVEVIYDDAEQQQRRVPGTVVTLSKMGVSQSLQADYTMIRISKENIGEVLSVALSGEWWNRYRCSVGAKLRSIEKAILVPRQAVYEVGGKTYVCIKEKDGTMREQSFVAGGSNDGYYWVVEGLTEGMEICLR